MPENNQHRPQEHRPQERRPGGERVQPCARRRRRRRPIWATIIIRVFQLIGTLLLIGAITGCLMACFAAVYVKTAIIPKTHLDLSAYTMNENSVIYYEDKATGQLRELQTLEANENREIIEYKDIPEDLINAFIAVEDKTFREHHGVNWKRTAGGLLYMLTGRSIQGGSTITQQLIKNVTEYDDVTVNRKILEIFTALDLEDRYSKEEILTVYLNKIFLGNRCYGVQAAAKHYFGKDVRELTLAECASLAGITNNPSLYAPYGTVDVVRYRCQNPECRMYSLSKDEPCEYCGGTSFDEGSVWTNREFNKARQELILNLMADPEISPQGAYITEAERDAAIAQPLVFARDRQDTPQDGGEDAPVKKTSANYSWYVEAVIDETIEALQAETGMDWDSCEQRVLNGGLSIICAYDPEAQAAVDTVYNDPESLTISSAKTGQKLLSAITVVDNSSGYVVAMGSTQKKTGDRVWNTPVQTVRQPGSSIKPLSVYSPGIEMGLITPATVIDDNPQLLGGKVWPTNAPAEYRGLTTVLDGLTRSVNTVALGVLDRVTPQASYEFMTERYGFTSLVPYMETSTGQVKSDIDRSPLSMGGLTKGVSTFEMAAAYATFPRGGKFTKATTLLEIRGPDDELLLDNRPEPKWAIKSTTAYYMNTMLTNVVNAGTGTAARISGQTLAGKTGTTNSKFDLWFCGYSAYYTAAVWTGYSSPEWINSNSNPAIPMWRKVMEILHEGKENREFDVPQGIALNSYYICIDCGKRAVPECQQDIRGNRVKTFRLFEGDGPTEFCTCHVPVRVCMDSPILKEDGTPTGRYHLAGEFCPEESVQTITMVDYHRELAAPSVVVKDASALVGWYDSIPEELRYCDVHTEYGEPTPPPGPDESGEPTPPPGPDESDEPFIPPIVDPTPTPPVEPTDPGIEPPDNPDDYIPAWLAP